VLTIFVAGHETTANALAWTFYLLSKFPSAARKIRAELAEVLGGRSPSVEDLPSPQIHVDGPGRVDAALPAGVDVHARRAGRRRDRRVFIPKGSFLFLSPYIVHRKPSLWEDPEGFDPERFAPERAASIPRFAYFRSAAARASASGTRSRSWSPCSSSRSSLQKYTARSRARVTPSSCSPLVTLRPKHGVLMSIHAA
jgi:cytochrome P450